MLTNTKKKKEFGRELKRTKSQSFLLTKRYRKEETYIHEMNVFLKI